MRVLLMGAGAWGTAVALHAARVHEVCLLARDPAAAADLRLHRENRRYLPGVPLPEGLEIMADPVRGFDWLGAGSEALLILATPVAGLRASLARVLDFAHAPLPTVWLCKGLERESALLPHQVVDQVLGARAPRWPVGVLSGPSFAQEVAAGLPVALTVAGASAQPGEAVVRALHHGAARIYRSDDLVGVEIGGALKNIMAIAAGLCDGLQLGHNARAALITRGLAEIARFGVALGARAETFMGLAGLGDLVLTCTGDLSRNRRVGLALSQGRSLPEILDELGHVAEGVACAAAVSRRARELGVELPIVFAVQSLLEGQTSPAGAIQSLLSREPRHE